MRVLDAVKNVDNLSNVLFLSVGFLQCEGEIDCLISCVASKTHYKSNICEMRL